MTGTDVGVIAASAVVVALSLGGVALTRRSLARRLGALAQSLEADPDANAPTTGLERNASRLERAVLDARGRVNDADVRLRRLAAALEAIPHGVVLCDENAEIVHRNTHAEPFVTARHGDVLVERALVELMKAAVAGEPEVQQLDLYGPPRRTLSMSAAPVDSGWKTIGAVVVIEDISERRRLEAVRRDFVANISHELKTPVGALGLLAETLADEDDPAVARRLAERMQLEAIRVGRIIEDLLDLSRIESEEAPVREPVAVHLVLAEAVERVRPTAELRSITIDVAEPPRRWTLMGERRQLVSAMYNLLENAVKYSDDGATVEVTTSATDGSWVELAVRDHGIGIPARDLERIFERFYRVDRARARDTGGTGLGLAIVRHVASSHGGEVRVESHEGEGSTFTLRLPPGPGPIAVREAG
jgi:two-component system sensor histidine kinase SenX3